MGALEGSLPDRAERAAIAGCDLLVISKTFEAYEEAIARVAATKGEDEEARRRRLDILRMKCVESPRPAFSLAAWQSLADDVERFLELLEKPRVKREKEEDEKEGDPS
jgi:beta-glucosidase-like glycosyl hydrolase